MKRVFFVMAILLSVATGAYAQNKSHPVLTDAVSPEAAGFSSERLKRIDTMLQGYVNSEKSERCGGDAGARRQDRLL